MLRIKQGWSNKQQLSLLAHILFTVVALLLLLLDLGNCDHSDHTKPNGLVHISEKRIVALNNRNLTIICYVDLSKRVEAKNLSFTTDGRIMLSLFTVPRPMTPLNQYQSPLHCDDPNRTRCRAEFNFDPLCLEDQMKPSYYLNHTRYLIEAACQVHDSIVCSSVWTDHHPFDCHDLGMITFVSAPKLYEACRYGNQTFECGHNQQCVATQNVCLCKPGYTNTGNNNKRCVSVTGVDDTLALITERATNHTTDGKEMNSENNNNDDNDNVVVAKADTKDTFKAIVIFLLVVAILLCIVLGIVIIWRADSLFKH